MSTEPSGKPDAWKLARPVWGWGLGETPRPTPQELETFLVKHDIPFDRHSDAQYEFDAENVAFRPGMARPLEMPSNKDGDTLLRVDEIRPVAEELARLATTKMAQEELVKAMAKVSETLNTFLPPSIEPLPPLTIHG